MPDPSSELRSAVERGEFAYARELWERWFAELERQAKTGALDPAEWERAAALYRWSRGVLQAERAHLLHHLNTLHAAGAYRPTQAPSHPSFVQDSF